MTHTLALPRVDFDLAIDEQLEEPGELFEDWWCVATEPFPCPAEGCDFVAEHVTAAHRIVVWADQDDRWLLTCCTDAKQWGRNPRIVRYEASMGAAINYYEWRAVGTPIHGKLDRPVELPRIRLL